MHKVFCDRCGEEIAGILDNHDYYQLGKWSVSVTLAGGMMAKAKEICQPCMKQIVVKGRLVKSPK